jgi:hypothetical protein
MMLAGFSPFVPYIAVLLLLAVLGRVIWLRPGRFLPSSYESNRNTLLAA